MKAWHGPIALLSACIESRRNLSLEELICMKGSAFKMIYQSRIRTLLRRPAFWTLAKTMNLYFEFHSTTPTSPPPPTPTLGAVKDLHGGWLTRHC